MQACDSVIKAAFTELGPINIYQIYADTCKPAVSNVVTQMARHGGPQFVGSAVAAHGGCPFEYKSMGVVSLVIPAIINAARALSPCTAHIASSRWSPAGVCLM